MRIEHDNGLARWTFIQPERGNPIDGPFCAEFCEAAIELSENPEVRAVLLTAEGKSFSFGGDVKLFVADLDGLPKLIKRWTADLHVGIARLQRMNAPVVADPPSANGLMPDASTSFVAWRIFAAVPFSSRCVSSESAGMSNERRLP
jgi:2-(1,2-epoxy-1,2-dihydrophenyl)acetyl-CoA isomerase